LKTYNHVARRHLIIPDTQIRPGVPIDHIIWTAQAIVDYQPDAVIHLGDHWDNPSFSKYDAAGSVAMEGADYQADLEIGNETFDLLGAPMRKEIQRQSRNQKRWNPETYFIMGNHEDRADRAAREDSRLRRTVGSRFMLTPGWKRKDYLERLWVDGVCYSHFFQAQNSSNAIGGSIDNRLNKIGESFVQGHQQGFLYSNRVYPTGRIRHGLVAGSSYLHRERYRGNQGNNHFRGIVVLNEVQDGDYCLMPLSMKYLCQRYEGIPLKKFMAKKYKGQNWDFLDT
jgi:hypothetical protein